MNDNTTDKIAIAFAPDGAPVADLREKLPGPHEMLPCREAVLRDWLIERNIDAGPWLARLEQQLKQDALSWLMLTNKAGLLLSGFDTVEKGLRAGKIALTLHASDARPDGLRKLHGLSIGLPSIHLFSSVELGRVIGRGQAVHLALKHGVGKAALQESFFRSCQRLAGFRETTEI